MIEVLLSWIIIVVTTILWGYTTIILLEKLFQKKSKSSFDMVFLVGMGILTIFSQFFSIFYKVGALAIGITVLLNIIFFFCIRKQLRHWVQLNPIRVKEKKTIIYIIVGVGLLGLFLWLTAQSAEHYDTGLYHAQSIRWIEEYGVVKGLGNLHNRLAYNSSFFSLQALFSFRFLIGKSLHTLNGLFGLFFVGYAVFTMKALKEKRIYGSDFFRVLMIYYFIKEEFSSPGSDIVAIGVLLYIFCKWIELWEEGKEALLCKIILSFLAVWAVSIKISALMLVIVSIYPAVLLIKKKEWKNIVSCIVIGIVVIAPFLIRNVLISGYIVYPYPELDLFQVDWKMPLFTLLFDRNEIKVWGQALYDIRLFDTSIFEWFPIWFERLDSWLKLFFILSIISSMVFFVLLLACCISKKYRKKLEERTESNLLECFLIFMAMFASLILWFVGAPLPRYGRANLFLIPCFLLAIICIKIWNKRNSKILIGIVVLCSVISLVMYGKRVIRLERNILHVPDYGTIEGNEVEFEDITLFVPEQGDQAGYYLFPSTPYSSRISLIELIGDDISSGIRLKSDVRNSNISTYGELYEENFFHTN
ncbi:MAG: LIC_10190 family membrane protein [Lachnospiraceae bacterium]